MKIMKCSECGMEIEIKNYEPIPGDLILCETCFNKSPLSQMHHSSRRDFSGKIMDGQVMASNREKLAKLLLEIRRLTFPDTILTIDDILPFLKEFDWPKNWTVIKVQDKRFKVDTILRKGGWPK